MLAGVVDRIFVARGILCRVGTVFQKVFGNFVMAAPHRIDQGRAVTDEYGSTVRSSRIFSVELSVDPACLEKRDPAVKDASTFDLAS